MTDLKILNVVGCRPNFVKIAPLMAEMKKRPGITPVLAHTGQHYDTVMSDVFFRDLELPEPNIYLNIGSGSHARQMALMCQAFEGLLLDVNPDLVLVVGDVNSTVSASLTAIKLGFPVAHVEAGLRSFDREMPEEINRVVTDAVADLLFATERSAVRNLLREGIPREKIFFVGNVMIDTLMMNAPKIAHSNALDRFGLVPKSYALVTLHRPSNVDDKQALVQIAEALEELQGHTKIVFPVHPRTVARLEHFGIWERLTQLPNIKVIEPLGYIDFTKLMRESLMVLTDSGGIQEESTALGIPCLTVRKNTERPVTITHGTNRLVGNDKKKIVAEGLKIIDGMLIPRRTPEKWDGMAAKRVIDILVKNAEKIKQLHRSVRKRDIWQGISSAA